MYTTNIVLITKEGKTAQILMDLLNEHYSVKCFYFTDSDINEILHQQKENLINSEVILLNLSNVTNPTEDIVSQLHTTYPESSIIVLHHYDQKTFADFFLKLGAKAYLPINFQPEELLKTINNVRS